MRFAPQTRLAAPKAKSDGARAAPALRPTGPIGNQAALRHLASAPLGIRPKLEIGAVDDPLEREADQVADKVMRMPDPALSFSAAPPKAQRKCAECEEEDKKKLQMKPTATSKVASAVAPSTVHGALATSGRPLDATTRAFFEPRFGQDFSGVRVHADEAASKSARAIGARAYAVGHHIAFAENEFSPSSDSGRQLLAHELAHVAQQAAGANSIVRRDTGAPAPEPSPAPATPPDPTAAAAGSAPAAAPAPTPAQPSCSDGTVSNVKDPLPQPPPFQAQVAGGDQVWQQVKKMLPAGQAQPDSPPLGASQPTFSTSTLKVATAPVQGSSCVKCIAQWDLSASWTSLVSSGPIDSSEPKRFAAFQPGGVEDVRPRGCRRSCPCEATSRQPPCRRSKPASGSIMMTSSARFRWSADVTSRT